MASITSPPIITVQDNGTVILVSTQIFDFIGATVTNPSPGQVNIDVSPGAIGAANRSLSNLLPTLINEGLAFDGATPGVVTSTALNSLTLGTGGTLAVNVTTGFILVQTGDAHGGSTSGPVTIVTGDGSQGVGSINIVTGTSFGLNNITPGNIILTTGNAIQAGSPSGNIELTTGSGQTNSGNITLTIGPGTTSGKIQFVDGSQGTTGQVWKSKDVAGSGTWASPSVLAARVVTVNGALTTADNVVVFNSGGALAITLPAGSPGLSFQLSNVGAGTATLTPNGGDTIQAGFNTLVSNQMFGLVFVAGNWYPY